MLEVIWKTIWVFGRELKLTGRLFLLTVMPSQSLSYHLGMKWQTTSLLSKRKLLSWSKSWNCFLQVVWQRQSGRIFMLSVPWGCLGMVARKGQKSKKPLLRHKPQLAWTRNQNFRRPGWWGGGRKELCHSLSSISHCRGDRATSGIIAHPENAAENLPKWVTC